MKVLQADTKCYPFFPAGGREKYIFYLSKFLVKNGIDVSIVSSLPPDLKSKNEFFEGIKYHFIKPNVTNKKLRSIWRNIYAINLRQFIRNYDFDILHAYSGSDVNLSISKSSKFPFFIQPFGAEIITSPKNQKILKSLNPFKKFYLNFFLINPLLECCKKANLVFSEYEEEITDLAKLCKVSTSKIISLPIGLDLDQINILKTRRCPFTNFTSNDSIKLLTVNRLDPVKGINYLIDSLKLLVTSNTKFELIIVGDGPEYLNLKNQISDLNLNHVVHLVGEVSEDDLYSFYNISDIYISPTLQKDWIMGVADALACGLPVVSTGQGIIVKNGINGLIINEKSSDSIVKGINTVLQNKTFRNKNLLIEINKPILEMYDWDKIAKKAIRIYEKSLS